jgi:SAM-dependent methyltransferase
MSGYSWDRLVCPGCRGIVDGRLVYAHLVEDPGGLGCPRCSALYPVVDGTPIVLRDVDAWLEKELSAVLLRKDLPDEVMDRLLRADTRYRKDRRHVSIYSGSPGGSLQTWIRESLEGQAGPIADLGCGMADRGRSDVLGVDLYWGLLQGFHGRKLVADIVDPPFAAEAFGCIVLANVVDSCREPWILLQQVDALLRPGGRLLLACPFAWDDGITPPAKQLDEGQLRSFFEKRGYSLDVGSEEWLLRASPRTATTHLCLTLDCRKPG